MNSKAIMTAYSAFKSWPKLGIESRTRCIRHINTTLYGVMVLMKAFDRVAQEHLLYARATPAESSRPESSPSYYNKISRGIITVTRRPLELSSNRGSRVELNRTIRYKPTAISTSSNNPLGQPYNIQFNVAISAQQLVAKQNKMHPPFM